MLIVVDSCFPSICVSFIMNTTGSRGIVFIHCPVLSIKCMITISQIGNAVVFFITTNVIDDMNSVLKNFFLKTFINKSMYTSCRSFFSFPSKNEKLTVQ